MKFFSLLTVFFFVSSMTAHAANLPLKTGLWEMTDEIILGKGEMEKILSQVPKEAHEQVKEMMKQQGIGTQSTPYNDCISETDLKEGLFAQGEDCKVTKKATKGNKHNFEIDCNDPKGKGSLEMDIEKDTEFFSHVKLNIEEEGEKRDVEIKSKGKWLAAVCPAV